MKNLFKKLTKLLTKSDDSQSEYSPAVRWYVSKPITKPWLYEPGDRKENMIMMIVEVRKCGAFIETNPDDYRLVSAYYNGKVFVVYQQCDGSFANANYHYLRISSRSLVYDNNDQTNRYLREIFIPNMEVKIQIEDV